MDLSDVGAGASAPGQAAAPRRAFGGPGRAYTPWHTSKTPRDYKLAIGLLAGAAIGTGLMLWLAPRAASELRVA